MVFGDVGRVKLRQDRDLLDNVFNFVLCVFDVDNFDGYRLAGPSIDPREQREHGSKVLGGGAKLTLCTPFRSYLHLTCVKNVAAGAGIWNIPMQFCLEYSVSGSTLPPPARVSVAGIAAQAPCGSLYSYLQDGVLYLCWSQALADGICGKHGKYASVLTGEQSSPPAQFRDSRMI